MAWEYAVCNKSATGYAALPPLPRQAWELISTVQTSYSVGAAVFWLPALSAPFLLTVQWRTVTSASLGL